MKKAKEMNPGLETLDLYLGLSYAELGKIDEACQFFDRGAASGDLKCKEAHQRYCRGS